MIQGKQVILRDLGRDDLPRLRGALQPGQAWQRLDGPYFPRGTAEDVDRQLERLLGRIEQGNWPEPRTNLIVADADTDQLIGRVSSYWQIEQTRWLSLGVVIFDAGRWRRGLGFEALGLWSQHVLDAMPDLARLDLRTWSGNVGMMRLAEKLGYRQEACFRKACIVDGEYHDGMGYGVLREEWESLYPSGFGSA